MFACSLIFLALSLLDVGTSLISQSLLHAKSRLPFASTKIINSFKLHSFSYLTDKDDFYITAIKQRSIQATKKALEDGLSLIEIEFPPLRSNDPTSAGTFDESVEYTRYFISDPLFKELDRDLFVVFPEESERAIAEKRWGQANSFVMTSLDNLEKAKDHDLPTPKVVVVIAPGFNIPEYEQVANLENKWPKATIIVINGYISRLRAGFYPSLFYPGLARITKSFYSRFEQVYHLSPIAVLGERLASWKLREYPDKWHLLLRAANDATNYDIIESFPIEPDSIKVWKIAKERYIKRTGRKY